MTRPTPAESHDSHPTARSSSWLARVWIRDADVVGLFDLFFVSAIVALVGIRMYLHATGFPRVGGGGIHIAHMLWGALLMLVALLAIIGLISRPVRWAAAFLGGIGFGLFIDELGKFVTSDNNYFFKPTDALIYAIFVGLFLVTRSFTRRRGLTRRERIANTLEVLKHAAAHDLDSLERSRALRLISGAAEGDEFAQALQRLVRGLPANSRPSRMTLFRISAARRYHRVAASAGFQNLLRVISGAQALAILGEVFAILLIDGDAFNADRHGLLDRVTGLFGGLSFISFLEAATAVVCAVLAVVGAAILARHRALAYRVFEASLLLSAFVIQPFAFYEEPYIAGAALVLTVPVLATVNYLLHREADEEDSENRRQSTGSAPQADVAASTAPSAVPHT